VYRAWYDGHTSLEPVELSDTLLATDADHVVAAVQRVLDLYCPSLPEAPTMHTLTRLAFRLIELTQ
jgi:hypothetical protein